eukprot:CCRYP_020629-RA/>CCRYP_020629-RA protein AED:0.31 eAED:0.31 QI:195/1/1/1/1/1/2/501/744
MKRRKGRNAYGGGDKRKFGSVLAVSLSAAVALLVCLCVLDFSGGNVNPTTPARANQCQTTCNARIHKAALETSNDYYAKAQTKVNQIPTLPNNIASPLSINRPKRLPTLIKILTGFHDNYNTLPYSYSSNNLNQHHGRKGGIIIAHFPKPHFPTPSNSIQQVATSAAYSIWKQKQFSIGKLGTMKRINQEWEESLRWIASWDDSVLRQQGLESTNGLEPTESSRWDKSQEGKVILQGSYSNQDGNRDDLTAFVNDLARLLQACIDTCLEDEEFGIRVENEDRDMSNDSYALGSTLIGDTIAKSFFSWALGKFFYLPFRISFGKFGVMFPYAKVLFVGVVRLIASSILVYVVHCLWNTSLPCWQGCEPSPPSENNSPEWLIEYEKEVEIAKKSRHRKGSSKKSKRKGLNSKPALQASSKLKSNVVEHSAKSVETPASHKATCHNDHDAEVISSEDRQREDSTGHLETEYYDHSATYLNTEDNPITLHGLQDEKKDDGDMADDNLDGVPSSISISTSSHSISNNDHTEDRNLSPLYETSPPPITQRFSTLLHRQPQILLSPTRKPLPVPTQEQRNEAAQQLREFQNAQIQRLLLQKKLAQNLKLPSNSIGLPYTLSAPLSGPSHVKVLKPPPGLNHPSNIQYNQDNHDDFFADNELLLSKLLDDDEDDDILSSRSETDSFPVESSLDPFAAPFVVELPSQTDLSSVRPQARNGGNDSSWERGCSSIRAMSDNGNTFIKGVYGGSVW